ncbi:hypothetical protein MMC17_001665 [Xylographa soralifera]|nr:hypothetical protein [Xylographa soralifera]
MRRAGGSHGFNLGLAQIDYIDVHLAPRDTTHPHHTSPSSIGITQFKALLLLPFSISPINLTPPFRPPTLHKIPQAPTSLPSTPKHLQQQKMHLPTILSLTLLSTLTLAIPVAPRPTYPRDNDHGLSPICHHLNTTSHGCVRYVRGFDVTGVVTEVDLAFPLIQDECDCIQQCLSRPTTCAAYVWKFSTPAAVQAGHRTCTLYSQFNLPSAVQIEIALNSSLNANINAPEIAMLGNNPQAGAPVPQAFKDAALNTVADGDAVSGPVWQLANGQAVC